MEATATFLSHISDSLESDNFVKITLSKPTRPSNELKNVYIRLITIKKLPHLSFTFRYKTKDQVQNFGIKEGLEQLKNLLEESFRIGTLFTLEEDLSLKLSKKGKGSLLKLAPTFSNKLPETHDREKVKRVESTSFLFHLGVIDQDGKVIPKMADKFRQINKFLEIMENQIQQADLPKGPLHIVDMGSGKGYLTFALYDYLTQQQPNREIFVTGIELREELVELCNSIAKKCGFERLKFESKTIETFQPNYKIDILIALHACDTATDDALFKALSSESTLIVCAPCCHKQIRQQVKGQQQQSPLLKYGIFKERQFEMVTDTIRALILEEKGYDTKIFEFVSNEHTRKNVMLTATKSNQKHPEASKKIQELKDEFGIEFHYLEKKLEESGA